MPYLSVVIPVFNEVTTLADVLAEVRECGVPGIQLIVVDDASTDGTTELLKGKLGAIADEVVFHEANKGKGAALRSGIARATGDFTVFQDADLEYSPKEFAEFVRVLESGEGDVVYGSRFLDHRAGHPSPFWHRMVNLALTEFSNLFTGYRLTDMETCYKVFPTAFLKSIEFEESRFGIEPELTAKAAYEGLSVVEVPIEYSRRLFEEGKKIGPIDGVRALYVIAKYGISFN